MLRESVVKPWSGLQESRKVLPSHWFNAEDWTEDPQNICNRNENVQVVSKNVNKIQPN